MAFVALGGDAGGSRPTYFEAYAAVALVPSLRSATVYALSVAARRSALARLLLQWEDEAALVSAVLLDWQSLRSTGGTFAESIYGLRREPMRQAGRRGAAEASSTAAAARAAPPTTWRPPPPPSPLQGPLSRRDVAAALATEALVPYLLVKWDRLHAWLLPYVTAARRRRLQLLQEQDREQRATAEGDDASTAATARARAIALAAAQLAGPGGGGGLVGLATARAAANMAMVEARRARRQREARRQYASGDEAAAPASGANADADADATPPPPLLPSWVHAVLRAMAAPLAAASNAALPSEEQDPDAHAAFRRRHELAERLVAAGERAARLAASKARAASAAASSAAARARETRACRAAQIAGLSLVLSLYPLARSALEMARFGYQANYLLAPTGAGVARGAVAAPVPAPTTTTTPTHLLPPSPLMHLAGQRLVRTSGTDVAVLAGRRDAQRRAQLGAWGALSPRAAAAMAAAAGAGPAAQLSAVAVAAAAAARARLLRAAYFASDNARSGLILAVFGFKALEWWYSSAEARLAATRALPPPPPPKPPPPHPRGCGLPPASDDGSGGPPPCPLCHRAPKAAPAALAVSGYVFCYACVFGHVSEHGCCPVTLMPARLDDIRKLYEQ
jgi:hypothetical protein